MNKMTKSWLFFLMTVVLLLGGCGSSDNTTSPTQKKTIVAATEGSMKGIAYMDKNNKLTGYEVEVLREAAKKAGL